MSERMAATCVVGEGGGNSKLGPTHHALAFASS